MSIIHAIATPHAPAALGPYSQAIRQGDLLWCSGQLGLDPVTGALREGVVAQTEQALVNLESVCRAAGTELIRAVKVSVFLADMADFPAMNEVYQRHFQSPVPARSTIQAAALPTGGRVEIDAVVVV